LHFEISERNNFASACLQSRCKRQQWLQIAPTSAAADYQDATPP